MTHGVKYPLTLKPRDDLADGEFLTGYNTKVMLGDREIYGVKAVDIAYRPGDVVQATVELFTVNEEITGAIPKVMMINPETGKSMEVAAIMFMDGTTVNFIREE